MTEQDLDRNEAATPYKLQRARERGSVSKSTDVNALAIVAVATLACFAWLPGATADFVVLMGRMLQSAGTDLGDWATANALLAEAISASMRLLGPLLLAVVCVAVVVNLAQSGPVFSFEPLSPDFTRVNPAQGLKRLFSLRVLYEAFKGVVKLGAMSIVFVTVMAALLPGVAGLTQVGHRAYLPMLYDLAGGLLAKMLAALLVRAAIDFVYSRREYAQRMRMSRREVKDEHKQREGDPRIRQRLRELRMKLFQRSQGMRQLPDADVLITNPTRVAVALRYEHGLAPAPRVVAKGAGGLARKMRDVAFRHGVPIVQSPPLARALYRQADEGHFVPEQWYPQVAKILVWVLAARRTRQGLAEQGTGGAQ